MKFEVNHYYHIAPEELELLTAFKQGLLSVERKLESILEQLNFMSNQEQQLNEAIASVRDAVKEGFDSVAVTVDKAAQRVIQRLEDRDIDLSDEIGILNDLKTNVRQTAQSVNDNLDQIAPPIRAGDGDDTDPPIEDTPPNPVDENLPPVDSSEADTAEFPEIPADSSPSEDLPTDAESPAPSSDEREF